MIVRYEHVFGVTRIVFGECTADWLVDVTEGIGRRIFDCGPRSAVVAGVV